MSPLIFNSGLAAFVWDGADCICSCKFPEGSLRQMLWFVLLGWLEVKVWNPCAASAHQMCQCSLCAVREGCLPALAVVTAGFGTWFPEIPGVTRISKCTHLIELAPFCNSFGDLPKQFTSLLHLARQKLVLFIFGKITDAGSDTETAFCTVSFLLLAEPTW